MRTYDISGEDTPTAAMLRECAAKIVFDRTRVADGLLFATHRDRCCYLGTSRREKPQWLKENFDKWRSLADVEPEAAPPGPPVDSEIDVGAEPAGPNHQTSSRGVRDDGDDEDDVALVDALAGGRSPPHEPTSLPIPVTATLTNRPTKAELLSPAKAAISEAEGRKTEATPLGAKDRKRGRGGDRHLKKQKLPADASKAGRKLSPERMERMRIFLDSLREYPILSHAASKAGVHRKTPAYWIKRSAAGDAGYDIKYEGFELRFHEHCQIAIEEAHDKVLLAMWNIAMGGVDENGIPILRNARKANKMLRFLAELQLPDKYGKHRKIRVPRHCGVLVIGGAASHKPKNSSAASVKARKWKAATRRIPETKA